VLPDGDEDRNQHDLAVSALLSEHPAGQPWWLGYLDTGVDDIVFPGAPMVTLYSGWRYVLAAAGPEQAATWRRNDPGSYGVLPDDCRRATGRAEVGGYLCVKRAEGSQRSVIGAPR
jgi:hypothetical protein